MARSPDAIFLEQVAMKFGELEPNLKQRLLDKFDGRGMVGFDEISQVIDEFRMLPNDG